MIEITTYTNTCSVPLGAGKTSTTHTIHRVDYDRTTGVFFRFANCNYNGRGRDITTGKTVIEPGESITGRLCGKCFPR